MEKKLATKEKELVEIWKVCGGEKENANGEREAIGNERGNINEERGRN